MSQYIPAPNTKTIVSTTNEALNKPKVQPRSYTSRTIPMKLMAKKFDDCKLELELWDHFGQLKLVDYAIGTYGYVNTMDPNGWLCITWKRYIKSIGHGHLWNYTLIRFWTKILYTLQVENQYETFAELYNNNPQIHNRRFFQHYYSNDVIFSPRARTHWVLPNLLPI